MKWKGQGQSVLIFPLICYGSLTGKSFSRKGSKLFSVKKPSKALGANCSLANGMYAISSSLFHSRLHTMPCCLHMLKAQFLLMGLILGKTWL